MSLSYLVGSFICNEFDTLVGRDQGLKPPEQRRYLDLVLYGRTNFVKVIVRDRREHTDSSEQGPWKVICNHDSVWRDSVRELIHRNADRLLIISDLGKSVSAAPFEDLKRHLR